MAKWLDLLVAAYRPLYLRGVLLDGPSRPGVALAREIAPRETGAAATLPTPPAGVGVDPMPVLPTRLETRP